MGCVNFKQRQGYEGPAVLSAQTYFSIEDVKALYKLFKKLSSFIKDAGFINKEDLQLGLFRDSKKQSLFADRIFSLFDTNNDGVVDFGEFIRSLSIFHPDGPQAEKIAFAFKLYNMRQTGFIEREEVKEMVLDFLTESDLILSNDMLEDIIDKTFKEADYKNDGKIDTEEWEDFVARNPSVLRNMTIPYLKDITATFPSFTLRSDTEDEMNTSFEENNFKVQPIGKK